MISFIFTCIKQLFNLTLQQFYIAIIPLWRNYRYKIIVFNVEKYCQNSIT